MSTHKCKGFTPTLMYDKTGDFIELYWDDFVMAYAEPHDGFFVMRGTDGCEKVVGVKIFGVSKIIKKRK